MKNNDFSKNKPVLLSNKTGRDQETNNEYSSHKKLRLSSPIPTLKEEDINDTLDEVLSRRKKEAVDKYTLYKRTNQIDYLIEAIGKDNTNSDIIYEYLYYLSQHNKLEFIIQYEWRCLFLKLEHMELLKKDDPYVKDSIDTIFTQIFDKIKTFTNTEEWLQSTKQLINKYKISNPYCLSYVDGNFTFTTNSKKEFDSSPEFQIKSIDDLRPNFPLSIEDKFIAYKELLTEMAYYVNRIDSPYILCDFLIVLREMIKTIPSHYEVYDTISRIMCSEHILSLPYILKYYSEKKNLQVELVSLDNFYQKEKAIIDSFNPYLEKIIAILTKFIYAIYNSNAMTSALEDLVGPEYLPIINKKFIDKALSQMFFFGFLNDFDYGLTDEVTNSIYINTQERQLFEGSSFAGNFLFNVFGLAVTMIHELFGHYAIRYIYFYTNRGINNKTERSKQIDGDGGDYLEKLLFDEKDMFNIEKILYFFDIKNWEKKVNQFRINYCSESNCSSIDNKDLLYEKISNNEYIRDILNIVNCKGDRIASALHAYNYKFMLKKSKQKSLTLASRKKISGVYPIGSTKIH